MPARLSDLRRALIVFGVETVEPSRGSHWKLTKGGFGKYPVPAHNGLKSEVADVYIKGLCEHFGIDRSELLKAL
jgi:hypothetical protein